MTDAPETPTAGHPPKRRKTKRRRRATRPRAKPQQVAAAAPDDLAGLTASRCCDGCGPDRCVISGRPYCAHPYKSAASLADPPLTARVKEARKRIAHQRVET